MANLNRFDLNLLVVLDTLLTERSVTRAADRLCVTQPAISASLQRLRDHFKDKLLIRIGSQMELTPKARALIEPVRSVLLQIGETLEVKALFSPAVSERTFRIAMSDFCVLVFLPHLVKRIAAEAPGVRIVIENVRGPSFSRLEGGELDVVVTHGDGRLFGREGAGLEIRSSSLFEDSFVCVVASDHPIGAAMTIDDYCGYPHAIADFGSNIRTIEDVDIERLGITLRETVLVPTFAGLLYQLPGTTLIATVQRKLAALLSRNLDIRVLEPPIELDTLKETVLWHRRNNEDPGHQWLRNLLSEVAGQMP